MRSILKRLVSSFSTGNFVGPLIFRKEDAPYYARGFIITFVTALVAGLLAIVYRFVCIIENRRRDRSGIAESYDHAYEDDMTDMKVCVMTSKRVLPGLT